MEDLSICEFEKVGRSKVITTPTISLVLFTLSDQSNIKRYLKGLKLWMTRLIYLFPRDIPVTLFVDHSLLQNSTVKQALKHKRVQGISFQCRDFMLDNHFKNLFPTLVRFFPAMSKNNAPLTRCCVHVFDIEPVSQDISEHLQLLKLVKAHNKCEPGRQVDFFYNGAGNPKSLDFTKNNRGCPYVFAGRLTLFRKFEHTLLTDFLKEMKDYGKREWYYGVMQTPFCRGVDEVFTNQYLLPYAISKGFTIAFAEDYCITAPLYWWKSMILANKYSAQYLQRILKTDENTENVNNLLKIFDTHFYGCRKVISSESKQIAQRYYLMLHELVHSNLEWFPIWHMRYVLKHFEPFIVYKRLVVVCTKKTTYVDLHKIKIR